MAKRPYSRWQRSTILRALKSRRVILLVGPRQCGKTTLVKELIARGQKKNSLPFIYHTLDNLTLVEAATNDPHGFVSHGKELMIIDEIQRVPNLLQAIKKEVDTIQTPGRFLLTGSSNIQALPTTKESLAGRIRKIRLRTLAEGELNGTKPEFITEAFKQKFKPFARKKHLDKIAYVTAAFRGGYPEAIKLKLKEARLWHRDYLEALIDRDLKDVLKIKRRDSMAKLIEVLATWSSKFMDVSAIGANLALTRPTLESYINALESLYLIERVRPWSKTDYDRISKRDKLFMTDSGLMTSVLRWRLEDILFDGQKNGKLIETFIFNQLSAILEASDDDYELYHYRDRESREIDFIVENEDGDLLGIEVKAGSAISKESFKYLTWFKENIAKKQNFIGIVLYTGEEVLSFGEHLWAVPISALWG